MTRLNTRTPDRRLILAGLSAALVAPTAAHAQPAESAPTASPASKDPAAPSETPPQDKLTGVSNRNGRLVAKVMINGAGPFRFVVDTGANTSVISEDLAAKLQLPPGHRALVHGIAGVQPATTVNVNTFRSGSLEIPLHDAPVLKAADLGADGLLGIDAFVDRRIYLDMIHNEVSLELSRQSRGAGSAAPAARMSSEVTVRARQRFGQLTIIDAEAGESPVTCFVDTGAEVSVGNAALYRRMGAANLPHDARLPAEVTILGATGQRAPGKMALVPSVRLGGVRFRNMPLVFADLHTFGLWGLGSTPALMLGMDILRLFELVTVDFGRRQVSFRMAGLAGPTLV